MLVGDSSLLWEPRAGTTRVCLRYSLFVVLPTTNSCIITHKKYRREKYAFFYHCTYKIHMIHLIYVRKRFIALFT